MASFPQINECPQQVLRTKGWEWERYTTPGCYPYTFWVGTDRDGCKWLTKLKGSFYGYREFLFSRLTQRMGWSCQTTVFAILDDRTLAKFGRDPQDRTHAVHLFMDEHKSEKCSETCPILMFKDPKVTIEMLDDLAIPTLLDWPKMEYAARLFGDPDGFEEFNTNFFTTSHEYVKIDGEGMFGSGPGSLNGTRWCRNQDGSWSSRANEIKKEVCYEFLALTEEDLEECLAIPQGVTVSANPVQIASIKENIQKSRESAKEYLLSQRGE